MPKNAQMSAIPATIRTKPAHTSGSGDYKPGTETDDDLHYALSPCINRPDVLDDMGHHTAQFFKKTEREFQRQEYQDAQNIEKIVYGGGRKRFSELPRLTHKMRGASWSLTLYPLKATPS